MICWYTRLSLPRIRATCPDVSCGSLPAIRSPVGLLHVVGIPTDAGVLGGLLPSLVHLVARAANAQALHHITLGKAGHRGHEDHRGHDECPAKCVARVVGCNVDGDSE